MELCHVQPPLKLYASACSPVSSLATTVTVYPSTLISLIVGNSVSCIMANGVSKDRSCAFICSVNACEISSFAGTKPSCELSSTAANTIVFTVKQNTRIKQAIRLFFIGVLLMMPKFSSANLISMSSGREK